MKFKTLWIAVGILLLVLCVSSCANENDQSIGTQSESDLPEQTDSSSKDENDSHTHTPSNGVTENVVEPTCEKDGSYDEVVYCSECGEEISRTKKNTAAVAHQYENEKCVVCGIDQPSDGLSFTSNGNGTCSVSGIGSCKDEDIIIPSVSPSGEKVTAIDSSAFSGCKGVISIRIPDTVKSIGDGAFQDCSDLESINLPDGITYIANSLFKNCRNLKSITIPKSVNLIGEEAFYYCISCPSIVIPANVKTIEKNAFINFSACDGTVKFENPNGWQCFDSSGPAIPYLDLTNERENDLYISIRYNDYTWRRE